jgi:hypothetical protein
MYSVTIYFSEFRDADWFAKMAAKSTHDGRRLGPLFSGIMQDSLAKANNVEGPNDMDEEWPSRQPANT